MNTDVRRLRRWLQRYRLQMPALILAETYRPLGFVMGQLLSAAAPFMPGLQAGQWGEMLSAWEGSDVGWFQEDTRDSSRSE